jgi:flavin reductase (DIM6/NTAB) family NADH-FMN oxidoreductase RutF
MSEITSPRQVVLVTSRADMEMMGKEVLKEDIITIAWHMPVSFNPLMYAISVGKTRYSKKLIQRSGCFVVNFIGPELEDEMLYCGSNSGEHTDKFKETKLTKEDSEKIDCPRIKQASAYMECEVVDMIDAGDHVIFVADVVHKELKKAGKRLMQGIGREFKYL